MSPAGGWPILRPDAGGAPIARTAAEPSAFSRLKSGTGFFVDGRGHMLTARHAVEDCARVYIFKEGRAVWADVVALSARADLALVKAPKTYGLPAVFPRNVAVSIDDLVFVSAYDALAKRADMAGMLGNAQVMRPADGEEARFIAIRSDATFGTSGAPVLDSRGLVEGVVSRRASAERVLAVRADEAKSFLAEQGLHIEEDDRPQIAAAGSRAHRAASISARVSCLQN